MDISDISKVANRKRLNTDAEKLREQVTRETAKIIKLKVAQDTAYWDLKEKLQQVEGNHERLQQNMVEVQMQHEAISGQYQDELRLRPETLNKMSSTREICDVLEEYSERLKETLSRCKRDQAVLCDAYRRSGQLVRDAQMQRAQQDHQHTQMVARLEDKLSLTTEHHNQLVQFLTSSKQRLESELADTRQKLAVAQQHKEELTTTTTDLRRQLDQKHHDLQAKEEAVTSLQKDIKQLLQEFNQQAGEMKNILHQREKDLKEATESNEALKKALANQEDFTKSIRAENSALQDKITGLEDEQAAGAIALKEVENKLMLTNLEIDRLVKEVQILTNHKLELENSIKTKDELTNLEIDRLVKEVEILTNHKLELENTIKSKDELLSKSIEDIKNLENQLLAVEGERELVSLELAQAKEENKLKVARIEELEQLVQQLENKITDAEEEISRQRETATQEAQALTATINEKEEDLQHQAETIAQLTCDVTAAKEANSRLDAVLQRLQRERDVEREAAVDTERKLRKQVELLDANVRNKDDELSKQMTIILDIRSEKERLQSKIEGMQGTIDNIQKELTGRAPLDHDDNALMGPPTKITKQGVCMSPRLPMPSAAAGEKARPEPRQIDSMLFSLFSDGSMDGDSLDPSEVNRRFEALSRGERVSPAPLGALKRRAGVPASQGGLKYKPATDDHKISLSQVKNDLKAKEKTFFKNKRVDLRAKRPK